MNMSKKTYKKYAEARAPRSPILKNCIRAFFVGGLICTIGQGLKDIYTNLCGMNKEDAGALTAATLVFVAVLLTGLGLFDRIAKFAGAGTLVPITGFANSVASPAIDSKSEGWVLGVGAKIFTVAGPVLLYGTLTGAVYGLIYWCVCMIGG
ncbi:MAG: stage V sporulation protein AC [Clostridia bacterium]|nr:stage V sporulation protein AC [Clostridia bacterium]